MHRGVVTHYVDAYPVAKKQHRCGFCDRTIHPGEEYWRQAGLDGATAWTHKTCMHCAACATAYCTSVGESEWGTSGALDWLRECHGIEFAGLLAGWRYPDGGLMPPPFERRCVACGVHVPRQQLWCEPCDARRIARIDEQLRSLLGSAS